MVLDQPISPPPDTKLKIHYYIWRSTYVDKDHYAYGLEDNIIGGNNIKEYVYGEISVKGTIRKKRVQ